MHLLPIIPVVAMSTSDDLIRTCLKIHVCVKVIDIACQPAAINFESFRRAARESPPTIFASIIMVAINSSNVLISATHKVHWLVKMVNKISKSTLGICIALEIFAIPAPSSISCTTIVNTLHLVHSSTFGTKYIKWLVVIILVLTFSEKIFHSLRGSICERKAHSEYNPCG